MMKLAIFASIAVAVKAACPNGCNGHGVCGTGDVCQCYRGFDGGDCSYRDCPKGLSFTSTTLADIKDDRNAMSIAGASPGAVMASSDNDVVAAFGDLYPKRPGFRQYTECSSRGTCDYATGQCKCFPGYEGVGCRRTTCPNKCSGHGRCLSNKEVRGAYDSYNHHNDQQFDQDMTQQCVCDRGFTGYDCSSRICPLGDDPTSQCGSSSEIDIQLLQVKKTSGKPFFTVTFEDMFGGKFSTRPVNSTRCSCTGKQAGTETKCDELQFALMELPNYAIPDVEVDQICLGTTAYNTYRLTFSSDLMAGKQNTLDCDTVTDPSVDGASPMYQVAGDCTAINIGDPEWVKADGSQVTSKNLLGNPATYEKLRQTTQALKARAAPAKGSSPLYAESLPCANKGNCDGATGTCSCANGHFGEACEQQSTYY